jgi:alanyl-tRNA synthetase
MIQAHEIRRRYVDFFVARGHHHAPSAPLVPPDDPTLLFTTAGMVQFKPLYSGDVEVPYRRAVSVQKCLRAGGKGSDLENVGRTCRHHTFFEMLGNFSFGDYFKKETIEWAWEFCTGEAWLNLPPERIWATVFGKKDAHGAWTVDEEAERLWLEGTGVVNPIVRLDEKENFWGPAGETGACGPCSEIKFFTGTEEQLRRYQELARSGETGMAQVAHDLVEEGDLFLEIWNLVFPQFDQQPDGSRPPLKNRGIDTGAGLERVTTACQMMASGGKIASPYETDLLAPLIAVVSEISGLDYPRLRGDEATEAKLREGGHDPAAVRLAMNACADHARTLTFALTEGVVPSNEGRGYVIRRILRRAARFGKKIGIEEPFLWKLIDPVIEVMGREYPEITKFPEQIRKLVRIEEERFSRTLHLGSEMLEEALAGLKAGDTLAGEAAYRLYDTYGFPLDLTLEVAEERGVQVDEAGYEKALAEGKARARASWKGGRGRRPGGICEGPRRSREEVGVRRLLRASERGDRPGRGARRRAHGGAGGGASWHRGAGPHAVLRRGRRPDRRRGADPLA